MCNLQDYPNSNSKRKEQLSKQLRYFRFSLFPTSSSSAAKDSQPISTSFDSPTFWTCQRKLNKITMLVKSKDNFDFQLEDINNCHNRLLFAARKITIKNLCNQSICTDRIRKLPNYLQRQVMKCVIVI